MSDIKDKKVVMHNIDGEEVDFSDLNIQEKAVKEHINLALQFKETFSKYLD